MLDDDPDEVQQKDDEDKAASMLEEGCRRVLVSTGKLRIDDDQLEHSHQYADDGDEEEALLRAAFEIRVPLRQYGSDVLHLGMHEERCHQQWKDCQFSFELY